jgi:D-alanyl-D-alanine carboxypeptidase
MRRSRSSWWLRLVFLGSLVLGASACAASGETATQPTPATVAGVGSAVKSPEEAVSPVATREPAVGASTPGPTRAADANAASGGTSEEASAPAAPAASDQALPAIDAGLAGALQAELDQTVAANELPGAVMLLGLPEQQPWVGASGQADREQSVAMTPETLFRIGSLSKMFTMVVTLQLVEEGSIGLDQPVADWLPDIVPAADRMTVRQLLSHTSGLYDYLDNQFFTQVVRDPSRVWTPEELIGYAVERGAYFDPGTPGRWRYSSTNYVLLTMIVERTTGTSLAQEVRQRILDPLALEQTFFEPDEQASGSIARAYVNGRPWPELHMSHARGTASVVSTVGDLRRFAEALFGGTLLEPETMEAMYGFVNANDSFGMQNLEYGLGVMRNPLEVGPGPDGAARPAELSLALGHIGGVSGYRAAVWYVPESQATIVVGFNEATVDPVLLPTRALAILLEQQGR